MWKTSLGAVAVFMISVVIRYTNFSDVKPPLASVLNTSYDYIIVGGGSAGCVLANRLSEDSDVTVLLIEAGPDDRGNDDISIPGRLGHLIGSDVDWQYWTVPQKHALQGYKEQKMTAQRGRVLGGSSSVNYMAYDRGHRLDYDRWAEQGCEGWSYKDVLPYFIKSENVPDQPQHFQPGYHGKEGPIRLKVSKTLPLTDVFLEAGREMGLNYIDTNADFGEGMSHIQLNIHNGQRMSTSRAFLHDVLERPNLHVAVDSFVTKIVFEGQTASGVEIIRNSRKQVVAARREVIVSAGTVGSPKLLMLSGIGPKDHLQQHGIPVVADLPVGDSLQDHMMYDFQVATKPNYGFSSTSYDSLWTWLQYWLFDRGPLSIAGSEFHMYLTTTDEARQLKWPDVLTVTLSTVWGTQRWAGFGFTQQALQEMSRRDEFDHGYLCLPVLVRPYSAGTVRLQGADPFLDPLIDPNYFADPRDVDTLVRGIRSCQRLVATRSMQAIGAELTDLPSAVCAGQHAFNTSHYWGCVARRNSRTMYHLSGTCKMGAVSDATTVVDPQLRVRGVQNLRVADASIIPVIPTAPTNAPVIMIAQKAADLIRQARQR